MSPGDEAINVLGRGLPSLADVASRVVFTSAAGLASHHCFFVVNIVSGGSGDASPVPGAGKKRSVLSSVWDKSFLLDLGKGRAERCSHCWKGSRCDSSSTSGLF